MMSRGRMALGIGIAAGALVMFTSFSNPPAQAGRLVDQASAAPFTPVQAWELRRTIFGDDSSEWANDGVCDDPRFAGFGVDHMLLMQDRGRDADDCRHLCSVGWVWLRSE